MWGPTRVWVQGEYLYSCSACRRKLHLHLGAHEAGCLYLCTWAGWRHWIGGRTWIKAGFSAREWSWHIGGVPLTDCTELGVWGGWNSRTATPWRWDENTAPTAPHLLLCFLNSAAKTITHKSSSILNGFPSLKVEACLFAKYHNKNLPPVLEVYWLFKQSIYLIVLGARGSLFLTDRKVCGACICQPALWHLITTRGAAETSEREETLQLDLIQHGLCHWK